MHSTIIMNCEYSNEIETKKVTLELISFDLIKNNIFSMIYIHPFILLLMPLLSVKVHLTIQIR